MSVECMGFWVKPSAKKWITESLLLNAINKNDIAEVIELIEDGADVDTLIYTGQKEKPAVCVCIEARYFDMAKIFIQNGCSLSLSTSSGMTPLHLAVQHGDAIFIKYLLENRANVNAKNHKNQTPLHLACSFGFRDMVEALVHAGSYVNDRDGDGRTPLILACMKNHNLIAHFLLKKGVAVNCSDQQGNTALLYAVSNKPSPVLVKLLLKMGAMINLANSVGDNALMCFVNGQATEPSENELSLKVLKILHDGGCKINKLNARGQNILHVAVCIGQASLVQKILNYGCKTSVIDSLGKTPLFYGCRCGRVASVELLIAAGVQWSRERWIYNEALRASCNRELVNICVQELTNVRKLKKLCRSTLRRALGSDIESSVKSLKCVPLFKRYLTLDAH